MQRKFAECVCFRERNEGVVQHFFFLDPRITCWSIAYGMAFLGLGISDIHEVYLFGTVEDKIE